MSTPETFPDRRTEVERLQFVVQEATWLIRAFRKHIDHETLQAAVNAQMTAEGRQFR